MIFHSIQHPNGEIVEGVLSLSFLRENYQALHMPDLQGKTVLDVGAADGFYALEFAKAGAIVTAMNVDISFHNNCVLNIEKSGLPNIVPILLSVYDLDRLGLTFDIICLMGVIYHLRHPLLAIDLCVSRAKELIVLESYYETSEIGYPYMKFFQGRELGNDPTNWWGPSLSCIEQMMQTAGCVSTKVVDTHTPHRVIIHGECDGRTQPTFPIGLEAVMSYGFKTNGR